MDPTRSPYAVPLDMLGPVPATAQVVLQPEPCRPAGGLDDRLDGGGDVDGDGD